MLLARLLVATGLVVTGVVHLDLADSYDRIGTQVTVGALFRVQGVLALLVAGWVLLRRHDPWPLLAAALLGLASTGAVVLSVYVRVPPLGPLPELYEPVWYRAKAVSAVASAVAAGAALALLGRRGRLKVT